MKIFISRCDHLFGRFKTGIKRKVLAARFMCDQSGLAAVEFALILPVMFALFIGVAELGQVLTVDRRVSNFASAAADLVAQSETVNGSALQDIYDLSKTILNPYSTSSLTLVLTSVVADGDNATTVEWSEGFNGGTAHGAGSDFELPEGLTQAFSSVIIAEVTYTYTSPVGEYIQGPMSITDTYYLRPRKVTKVVKTD